MWERVPAAWRTPAAALVAFVLGVAAGMGTMAWRQSGPEPAPLRVDEHAVELVLFRAVPARSRPGASQATLHVDGALLLSGSVTSTILTIRASGSGLGLRVPALPVTVSPTARLQEVVLEVVVRDCGAAMRWAPKDRPFVITWRDEYDRVHTDRAGDFSPPMSAFFNRYLAAACDEPTRRSRDSGR